MLRKHRRMSIAAGLVGVGLACTAVAWATLLIPQPVVTAKGRQYVGGAAPDAADLAFAQSRPGHPHSFDVYVKQAGLPRYKVNQRGQGFAGGIDGTTLIWQSVRNHDSNLRLFDLSTHVRSVPTGVNTRRWEFWPSMSGDWILYGQSWSQRPINWRVILHNETSAETRILAERINRPHAEVEPGQVNGDFATWGTFNSRTGTSQVVLYQISTSTKPRIPEPTGKVQYYPAVTAAGNGLLCPQRTTTMWQPRRAARILRRCGHATGEAPTGLRRL